MIHNNSCHPNEHKKAGINYLINRMNSYPITPKNKTQEKYIINQMLTNNGYKQLETYQKQKQTPHNNENTKWATFTYFGPATRTITKLFRNTNIKIAYKTHNTLKRHLVHKPPETDTYNKSGVYMLKCKECPLKYVGQTGRTFKIRFNEHMHDIKYNKYNSKYAQHILDTGHQYGTINQTMDILHIANKGQKLNTLEKFEIYKLKLDGLHLNDACTVTQNPIFDTLIRHNSTETPCLPQNNT